MAENLKGVFERSMRRTFRVYLEPACHRTTRKRESWGESTYLQEYGYAGQRQPYKKRRVSTIYCTFFKSIRLSNVYNLLDVIKANEFYSAMIK